MEHTYDLMANVTLEPDIIGRKVRLMDTHREHHTYPGEGKVVGYDDSTGIVMVEFVLGKEPRRLYKRELWLRDEPVNLTKTLKFSGKKFGALEEFIAQAKREGAKPDTVLNPKEHTWVAILVELPLATEPAPKHNHDFDMECTTDCPHFGIVI